MRILYRHPISARISLVIFWLSLLGACASIIGFWWVLAGSPAGKVSYVFGASTLYIVILIGCLVYLIMERGGLASQLAEARRLAAYKDGYEALHAITHEFRWHMARIVLEGNVPSKPNAKLCRDILDKMKSLFEGITGARCATAIKLYHPKEGVLSTLERDGISTASRMLSDYDRESRVDGNSASRDIILAHTRHFFGNNLTPSQAGEYRNDRPDWCKYYLSNIVWPIRYCNPKTNVNHIVGLLAVDSPETDVFDRHSSLHIGAAIADLLYPYLAAIYGFPEDVKNDLLGREETSNKKDMSGGSKKPKKAKKKLKRS